MLATVDEVGRFLAQRGGEMTSLVKVGLGATLREEATDLVHRSEHLALQRSQASAIAAS